MICMGFMKVIGEFIFSKESCETKQKDRRVKKDSVKDLARDILGVPQNTSVKEIKKAYISLIKEYHPDNYMTANTYIKMEMEEKSKLINWAYNELKSVTA